MHDGHSQFRINNCLYQALIRLELNCELQLLYTKNLHSLLELRVNHRIQFNQIEPSEFNYEIIYENQAMFNDMAFSQINHLEIDYLRLESSSRSIFQLISE